MSNANYNASVVTQRRQNKVVAGSFINRIQNGSQSTTSYGPLAGNFDQSVVQAVTSGQQTQYRRSEENCVVADPGCPCGVASISSPVIGCGDVNFNTYWATNIKTTTTNNTEAFSTIVSPCGNTYVVGYYAADQITFSNFALPQPAGGAVNQTLFGTLLKNSSAGEFAFVAKYDVNGTVQWVTHMGLTSGTGGAQATGVAIDANENIYVTGYYTTSSLTPLSVFNYSGLAGTVIQVSLYGTFPALTQTNGGNVFLVKYDTNGQAQWATKLDSGGFDEGLSIAVDSAANVYLTGYYGGQTTSGNLDVYTVVNTITPMNITSYGTLANTAGSGQAAFVAKYNANGQTQWATSIRTDNAIATVRGNGIAVDTSGNVYVTGQYRRQPVGNFTVTFNSFQSQAPTINVTLFGTIQSFSSGFGDIFLVKYNTGGVIQWVTNMTGASDDIGNDIAVDASGSVYVTGMFQSTITLNTFGATGTPMTLNAYGTLAVTAGTQAAFVAKYSTNGQTISWVARVDCTGNDVGKGIAVDNSGNTYICGIMTPQVGGSLGQRTVTFSSLSGIPSPLGTAFPFSQTNTFIGGDPNQPQTGQSGFVAKFNSLGAVQWATSLTRPAAGSNVSANSVALDPNGNIHVTGVYIGNTLLINNYANDASTTPMNQTAYGTMANSGFRDVFLVKYNPNGQIV